MTRLRPGAFDVATFLRDDWQVRPRLIRNPWAAWTNPLDPDDLAGLACEGGVESRIVRQGRHGLKVEHGPFAEKRFAEPTKRPWTLLVQAVDHVVPEVAALLDAFDFLPNWRIDDVMVSYAVDGGGVGAHFDNYDVFLVQGLGQRRWQVGGACDAATPLLPHDDLRLLADFAATGDWLLEPGDILYVPPGIAHHGVAVGDDCMTYSIGCRAPSRADLIGHWCDDILDGLSDDDRFADPGLAAQANPGEISAEAITALHGLVTDKMLDRDAFVRWFGQYSSTPKYADAARQPATPMSLDGVRARLADAAIVYRHPASRFAFVRRAARAVTLFVDGNSFECIGETAAFAQRLCASRRVEAGPKLMRSDAAMVLLGQLLDQGSLTLDRWHEQA